MSDIYNNYESIYDNDYNDLIIYYEDYLEQYLEQYNAVCYQVVDDNYAILHALRTLTLDEQLLQRPVFETPRLFFPCGRESLYNSRITYFHERPSISLTGNGVLIGIVDTGIDYTHSAFIFDDNTSKILRIWDQTRQGRPTLNCNYGTEYTNEVINLALNSENPYEIVNERDINGHGTFLAGIAAGRENIENNFIGAAPDAELVVVKLKPLLILNIINVLVKMRLKIVSIAFRMIILVDIA